MWPFTQQMIASIMCATEVVSVCGENDCLGITIDNIIVLLWVTLLIGRKILWTDVFLRGRIFYYDTIEQVNRNAWRRLGCSWSLAVEKKPAVFEFLRYTIYSYDILMASVWVGIIAHAVHLRKCERYSEITVKACGTNGCVRNRCGPRSEILWYCVWRIFFFS